MSIAEKIDRMLVNIEARPRMYAPRAYAVESLVLVLVSFRQDLRGYDEFDVMAAMQHYLYVMSRRNHPCGLTGLLKDHGMLGRGYVDNFGDLPRLLGDFARWVDRKWPSKEIP